MFEMSPSERNTVGRSTVIRIVFFSGLAGVVAGTCGIRLSHDQAWIRFFDNLHWTSGTSAGAILGWLGYWRVKGTKSGPALWSFAAGLTLYAVGQLVWDLQTALSYSVFPSPSDLFYLWLGPGLCLGLFLEIRRNGRKSEFAAVQLDILALAIASMALVLALYLPRRGQLSFLAVAVLTAYPTALITAASIGVVMILALRLRSTIGLWQFLASVAVTAWSWMTWNLMALDGTTTDGSWFNVSFSFSVLLMGLAFSDWDLQPSESPAWDKVCEAILRLLPFLSVIAACAAVLTVSVAADVPAVSEISVEAGSVLVIVLATISQVMSLKERDLLLAAQKEIIASKALLQTAVDAVPVRVFWKGRDCRYLGCNAAFASDAGLEDPSQIIGKTDDDLHWKEQARLYQDDDREVMETDRPKLGYEEPQSNSSGLTIQLRTSKVPLKQDSDGVIGVVGVYEDITERKQAEDNLRQSEEKYRRIVDTAFEGIVTLNVDGRLSFVNGRMTAMLGFAADEMLGRPIADFTASEEMADHRLRMDNRHGGISENYERQFIHKDGHGVWTYCSSTPIMDKDGRFMGSFGMYTDITERKRAEEELLTLNDELEARVRERTAEIQVKNAELERTIKLFVGRELRMVELKERIRELEKLCGEEEAE